MKLRLDWIPATINVAAIVLLLPFFAKLVGIVIDYIADLP